MPELNKCPVCGADVDEKATLGLYGKQRKPNTQVVCKCGARYDLRYGRFSMNCGWDGGTYYCPKILETVVSLRAQLKKALEIANNA